MTVTTEWFDKRPGENIAVGSEDPTMLLIGAGVPDWVQLPAVLGGARVRVLCARVAPCPHGDHEVRHLRLDEPSGICVADCGLHGFLWYRARKAEVQAHTVECEHECPHECCPSCDGTGRQPCGSGPNDCPDCIGTGVAQPLKQERQSQG